MGFVHHDGQENENGQESWIWRREVGRFDGWKVRRSEGWKFERSKSRKVKRSKGQKVGRSESNTSHIAHVVSVLVGWAPRKKEAGSDLSIQDSHHGHVKPPAHLGGRHVGQSQGLLQLLDGGPELVAAQGGLGAEALLQGQPQVALVQETLAVLQGVWDQIPGLQVRRYSWKHTNGKHSRNNASNAVLKFSTASRQELARISKMCFTTWKQADHTFGLGHNELHLVGAGL